MGTHSPADGKSIFGCDQLQQFIYNKTSKYSTTDMIQILQTHPEIFLQAKRQIPQRTNGSLRQIYPENRHIFHLIICKKKTIDSKGSRFRKSKGIFFYNNWYLKMRSTVKNEIDMLICKTFKIFHKAASTVIRVATVDVLNFHVRIPTHFSKPN